MIFLFISFLLKSELLLAVEAKRYGISNFLLRNDHVSTIDAKTCFDLCRKIGNCWSRYDLDGKKCSLYDKLYRNPRQTRYKIRISNSKTTNKGWNKFKIKGKTLKVGFTNRDTCNKLCNHIEGCQSCLFIENECLLLNTEISRLEDSSNYIC